MPAGFQRNIDITQLPLACSRAGQHAPQHVVAQHKLVEQRSRGMASCEDYDGPADPAMGLTHEFMRRLGKRCEWGRY